MSVRHHELCFGCGRTNLFGLLLDARREPDGAVRGACFVKQDHQGPQRGEAHPGVLATALAEALMLAADDSLYLRGLEVEFEPGAVVAVGEFCEVRAQVTGGGDTAIAGQASASAHGRLVARARGSFAPRHE